jgi:hypothetical protein
MDGSGISGLVVRYDAMEVVVSAAIFNIRYATIWTKLDTPPSELIQTANTILKPVGVN